MSDRLKSRKLWVAITAMVAEVVIALGGDPEVAQQLSVAIAGIAGSYVIGQGVADHGKKG
jgi:hypothetical protein